MKQLAIIFSAIWIIASIWFLSMRIEFNQNCKGLLKQAADANTVELALERLDKALCYIEKKGWTDGYTSVLYKTEDENVGFWYANLKASRQELVNAQESSQLEQTNVLMKLRETLSDNGENGTYVTYPAGLWKYPHNALYGIIAWIVNILGFLGLHLFLSGLLTGYKYESEDQETEG